ncbi:Uncharacterised protein [Mycobacterium tuberculosis]|uniref:Uncharacterized protein n=1 Tax=Mycobacterium tuberculosis TaxID=1773 RepID=A0A916LGJ9_MYCTX|nr:Uncharacterised protein [Mycobacterium tuberculosis]CPA60535.1 Uncharacterised protein [Mycobacterium tuberculosis]
MPNSARPAANGTTTEMIAVTAHSAAITDACANSLGRSGPPRCCAGQGPSGVTSPILPGSGPHTAQHID